MTTYFLVLTNALLTYAADHAIRLYPMWKTRDVKARSVVVYFVCLTILLSIWFFLANQVWGVEMPMLNSYIIYAWLPMPITPFFIFRKRVWQNIFLYSIAATYAMLPGGINIYAAEYWFNSLANPLLAVVALKAVITLVTLPPLLYVLRRIAENTSMDKAVVFWRLFWLIPMLFLLITMFSGNFFTSREQDISFVIFRFLSFVALVVVCYLLDMALRQVSAVDAANREKEEFASKTDFYRKMSHSLRTPLTIVSTNIQTAKRRPQESDELLDKSQTEIMKMANTISDALKDGEKGAGE